MEEMRLFEVGFKKKPYGTGYFSKFYVVASDGEEAIEKARKWLHLEHLNWWTESGREERKWDLASPDFEKLELPEEEFDSWCESNNSYDEELDKHLIKDIEGIRSVMLAKVYDVGNTIV